DGHIDELARNARERPYAPGELIIVAGAIGDAFFIVQQGEVAVVLGEGSDEVEVARLPAGSFFGEMSFATGTPRSATGRAVTDTLLLAVDKAALQPILDATPELAERITEVLSERQEELDSASSKSKGATIPGQRFAERGELLQRIKNFFSLSH